MELVIQETPRGEGTDMVFECAGFLSAMPKGQDYCRRRGTLFEPNQCQRPFALFGRRSNIKETETVPTWL